MIIEAIMRGWENFISRASGPFHLRFFIQPAIGIIMAFRAGLQDARAGRPAYLWSIFINPANRRGLLQDGWRDMATTFIISVILDSIYQLINHQSIYLLELIFTATLLALVPYLVLRGPFNRLAQLFIRKNRTSKKAAKSHSSTNHLRR